MSKNDQIPFDLDTKASPFKTKQSLRITFFIEHDFIKVPDKTHRVAAGCPSSYVEANQIWAVFN